MPVNICRGFFPNIFKVTQSQEDPEGYRFWLLSTSKQSICPLCGIKSARLHGYQERTVKDLPILGKGVTLHITQKKYFCDNKECEAEIFTEDNDLVNPYSQFTTRCREYMLKVATHISSEAAARIFSYQGIRVSGDTLLNMLKEAGKEYKGKVGKRIGVDDWAYRRGKSYGTIICDLESHEVIEVLEGRDGKAFEEWLKNHPDIEIVSRDRASAYSSAVNNALPKAVQVADRFHITKNLLEALNETMKGFMPEVVSIPNNSDQNLPAANAEVPEISAGTAEQSTAEQSTASKTNSQDFEVKKTQRQKRMESQEKRKSKVQSIHEWKREGYDDHQIAAMADVSGRTVRRLLRVDPAYLCVDGTRTRERRNTMEPYRGQVSELLDKGFKPSQILKKLQTAYPDRVFKRTTVNDLCCSLREEPTGCRSMTEANIARAQSGRGIHKVKRRDLSSFIWSGGDKIPVRDLEYIKQNFPVFIEIQSAISAFRTAYTQKDIEALNSWVEKHKASPFPSIQSFIKGIRADEEAFVNSIKFEYSNGLLEGSVNKLKTIKRSMFGRAHYALLRAKILLSNH